VTGIDGQEWLWRAFRGYVVTERSRSNVIGLEGSGMALASIPWVCGY